MKLCCKDRQHQGCTILLHDVGSTGVSLAALTTTRDLMGEPQGLPPSRRHDHRIHLLPGTAPVAVRSYRYPQLLKNEIEHQCDVMLVRTEASEDRWMVSPGRDE
jgi:hypothetical protein